MNRCLEKGSCELIREKVILGSGHHSCCFLPPGGGGWVSSLTNPGADLRTEVIQPQGNGVYTEERESGCRERV